MTDDNLLESIRDTVRVSKSDTVGVSLQSKTGFARIPYAVLRDVRLSPIERLVYAELAAWTFHGNVARRGQRAIADALGIRQATVSKALVRLISLGIVADGVAELVKRGLVSEEQAEHWRGIYVLTSPVFGANHRKGIDKVVSSPRGSRRIASVGEDQRKLA